ncbi:hypothetical protein TRVL_05924 [Trypanosoma vivax]|uniref:Uncharacterized protein n=1 Tax=Trypanosoma vivax (strain Y486) TaxID=1055687 RepID=G0TRB5_TRYVY|nr:hypothetical protein TRVL_05924 [Trypanosoma vivax]CCC46479.1 conserved hypothetical protein, in T. vivax [Trypanosoma vivax Y486]
MSSVVLQLTARCLFYTIVSFLAYSPMKILGNLEDIPPYSHLEYLREISFQCELSRKLNSVPYAVNEARKLTEECALDILHVTKHIEKVLNAVLKLEKKVPGRAAAAETIRQALGGVRAAMRNSSESVKKVLLCGNEARKMAIIAATPIDRPLKVIREVVECFSFPQRQKGCQTRKECMEVQLIVSECASLDTNVTNESLLEAANGYKMVLKETSLVSGGHLGRQKLLDKWEKQVSDTVSNLSVVMGAVSSARAARSEAMRASYIAQVRAKEVGVSMPIKPRSTNGIVFGRERMPLSLMLSQFLSVVLWVPED